MIELLNKISENTIVEIKNARLKSELSDIDYKEIYKISDRKSKVELIKDITSFANSKGGYIIFGVTNDGIWTGLDDRSDVKFDSADIAQIIDEYVDGEIQFLSNIVEIENASFIVFYINGTSEILPFKKDGQYHKAGWGKDSKQKNVTAFNRGDVYCRRGS